MTEPLNQTERRVYEYLIDFLAEHTYQPSIREIGRQFRIKSTKTVSDVLQALARKGYIERDPSRSRGVRLVGYTGVGGTTAVPYYTAVQAGSAPVDPSARAGHLVLDRRLATSDRAFMLRATGDAMRAQGVLEGDYVVVDPTGIPEEGSLVAVRLGSDAQVRAWSQRDGATTLLAADPAVPAITVRAGDDVTVLGVVSSVIRSFAPSDPIAQPLVPQTAAPLQ
jgi:repressor LexA